MKCDILIAGVGGQGQVLASRLLGEAAIGSGFNVRTSETIGMSQRGGSVTSNVRIGGSALSATVPIAEADLLIGFEICETVRNIDRLSPDGGIVLNTQVISPVSVSLGKAVYDKDKMLDFLRSSTKTIVEIDALGIAESVCSLKTANVVMLGAACGAGMLPFKKESFIETIIANVPSKYSLINKKAFEMGYQYASKK